MHTNISEILERADQALAYAMDGGDPIDAIGSWMEATCTTMERIDRIINKVHKLENGLYGYIAKAWHDTQADRICDAALHGYNENDTAFYENVNGRIVPKSNPWGTPG